MKRFVLLFSILAASPAFATDIDFSKLIVGLDGEKIPSSAAKDAPPLDLKTVATGALLVEKPADPHTPPDPADKQRRFDLAIKVHKGGVVDLLPEEITQIKAAIAGAYGALVVGRADEILNGK